MIFDWGYAWDILPQLGRALVVTLQATALGMALALALGLVFALARRSRYRVVAWPAAAV